MRTLGILTVVGLTVASPCRVRAVDANTSYGDLIVAARSALSSGDAVTALSNSNMAIKLEPSRWEGYAIGGAALILQRKCDAAVDLLTDALSLAPEDRRAALKDLARPCFARTNSQSDSSPETGRASAVVTAVPPQLSVPAQSVPSPTAAEIVFWEHIQDSKAAADYRVYLQKYPDGVFSALARSRINELDISLSNGRHEERVQSGASAPVPTPQATSVTQPEPVSQPEVVLWKSIQNSTDMADFEGYLSQYPHGAFASVARSRIQQLKGKESEDRRARLDGTAWRGMWDTGSRIFHHNAEVTIRFFDNQSCRGEVGKRGFQQCTWHVSGKNLAVEATIADGHVEIHHHLLTSDTETVTPVASQLTLDATVSGDVIQGEMKVPFNEVPHASAVSLRRQ